LTSASYELRSGEPGKADFTPYGQNLEFIYYRGPEAILSGPAETGKTLAACWKLHSLACTYPGAQLAIVRKTQNSLYGTVLQTYEKRVLGKDSPVKVFGGSKPEWYDYPNGSRIYTGGLDNPDKVLSSERDVIYVNQAEELMPADWETLLTRTTGRAGNMPYSQCIGDCNPAFPSHWIIQRSNAGSLKLFTTTHKDNPTLWDMATQTWTKQGELTLSRLSSLTGMRRARLFLGQWVQAEGVVYDEFTRDTHVKRRDMGDFQRYIVGVDEGYTNPAVLLLIGLDGDGRAHILREFYQRRVLQGDVVAEAARWWRECQPETYYVDPSAAGLIAEMIAAGLPVIAADHAIQQGIQTVKARLAQAGDGRPRLTVDPTCDNTIAEFESYVWKQTKAGIKDEPEKQNDHAMDALRYALMGENLPEYPDEGIYVYDERVAISPY
jgi:PBSX family phage terminase large subunit